MPSAPTTSLDLEASDFLADPYPFLAEERARHALAWHEGLGMYLTFTHGAVDQVLRNRSLQRLWVDREPREALEPFNALHRSQMMENEGAVHTRLRRPVANVFTRSFVEDLRVRVCELAVDLLAEVDPTGFDVMAEYAEVLPVLVIADLLGIPESMASHLRAWSQAIVKMYEPTQSDERVRAAVAAAEAFDGYLREFITERRTNPDDKLVSRLIAESDLNEDELVATAILLLNAGHEATVNVFGNGLVALLQQNVSPLSALTAVETAIEEMLRFDSAAQLFVRTATASVEIAGVTIESGQKVAALLGAANRDPAVFHEPNRFVVGRRDNPHLAFGAGVHFCIGAPLARMELAQSLGELVRRFPKVELVDVVPRGTFTLRGHDKVVLRG